MESPLAKDTTFGYRWAVAAVLTFLLWGVPAPAGAITLELSGQVTFRPQGATRALSTTQKTIALTDDSLQATARMVTANVAERKTFPLLVLQRQYAVTKG